VGFAETAGRLTPAGKSSVPEITDDLVRRLQFRVPSCRRRLCSAIIHFRPLRPFIAYRSVDGESINRVVIVVNILRVHACRSIGTEISRNNNVIDISPNQRLLPN